MISKQLFFRLVGAAGIVSALLAGATTAFGQGSQAPTAAQVQDLSKGGGVFGLGFVENAGQWDSTARYYTSAGNTRVWVTDSSIVYDFWQATGTKLSKLGFSTRGHVVSMEFQNSAQGSAAVGVGQVDRKVNFITNKGTYRARTFSSANIKGIYDGVDLKVTKESNNPRFDLVVAPGHSVSNVLVNYRGASGLTMNKDGTLDLGTSLGRKQIAQLRAFQNVDGAQQPVDVKFDLHSDGLVGFKVGRYDKSKALTIDPTIFSSLIGDDGASFTQAFGVAVGQDSAPVIAGVTTAPDFPVTVGAYDRSINGVCAFVTKFSQDGSHLLFCTVLNSTNFACGTFVQIDGTGRVILAGFSDAGYPVTTGAQQTAPTGGFSFANVLSVLSADGSQLMYSTYYGGGLDVFAGFGFGGNPGDAGFGDVQNIGDDPKKVGTPEFANILNLQVDETNRIYLIGEGTITPTSNALMKVQPQDHTYVACFNPTGTLHYATYYGAANSVSLGAAVAQDGGVFLCGETDGHIVATQGAFQTQAQAFDGFITKLAPVTVTNPKVTVAYTTYIGGSGNDDSEGIAVDSIGEAYVWGISNSIDFPITLGALEAKAQGNPYVAKFDAGGAHLLYATYAGIFAPPGSGRLMINAISVDPEGDCYLAGSLNSKANQSMLGILSSIPYNPAQPFNPKTEKVTVPPSVTPGDAFLYVIDPTGTSLLGAGVLGGTYDDVGEQLAMDSGSNCYMVGWTDSFGSGQVVTSSEFPTTLGAFDTDYGAGPPTGSNAPFLPWNFANEPPGSVEPWPMGFLAKIRVTNALYLTNLTTQSVVPGGTFGGGKIFLSGIPTNPNFIPVEISSSNPGIIPSTTVDCFGPPTNTNPFQPFGFPTTDVTVQTPVVLTAFHDGVYLNQAVQVVPLLQSFSVAVPSVVGGNNTTARVYISETIPAPPNGKPPYSVTVTINSSNPAKAIAVPSTLTIFSGSSSGLATIQTFGVDDPTAITFSAQITSTFLPNTNQQVFAYTPTSQLNLLPASVSNIVFNPQIVLGGYSSVGTVVLNGQVGPTPITVKLTETSGTAPISLSTDQVTIPAGQSGGNFGVNTQVVFGNLFRTLTALQANNGATASGTIFVNPILLGALQLISPTITGGSSAQAYVVLSAPAGPSGVNINLSSSDPTFAKPAKSTITVAQGASKSGIFLINTPVTNAQKVVTLTASLGTLSQSNNLVVEPEGLTLTSSASTQVGSKSNFTFTATIPNAEQNLPIAMNVTSNGGAALSVPATATVQPGKTSVTFTGTTGLVTTPTLVTVTASFNCEQGTITATSKVTVNPLPLVVTLSPTTLVGGIQNGKGTVKLGAVAAAATAVTLTSSNPAASPNPTTITIPKGSQTGTFNVVSGVVSQKTQVVITATDSQGSNSAALFVLAPDVTLTKLTLANNSVSGGANNAGTLSLTGVIPPAGIGVTVSSNSSLAQVPPTLQVNTGTTSTTFPITTSISNVVTVVTIKCSFGASSVSASFTITAIVQGSLTITPASVVGSNSVTLTVSITGPAPAGGITVQLSQTNQLLSNSSAGISLNGQVIPLTGAGGYPTITIPAGQTSVTATLATPVVSSPQQTTITGVFVGQNAQASGSLQVTPQAVYHP